MNKNIIIGSLFVILIHVDKTTHLDWLWGSFSFLYFLTAIYRAFSKKDGAL